MGAPDRALPSEPDDYLARARRLCDMLVDWQAPDGQIDKTRCPYFAESYKPDYRHMQLPIIARALYAAYLACGCTDYRTAADRYCRFYIDVTLDRCTANRIYACYIGPALEAAVLYARNNLRGAEEMRVKAGILYRALQQLRNKDGQYFRIGYTSKLDGWEEPKDRAYSEDLCHAGRGLVRYYEMTTSPEVLADIQGLSRYYLTDVTTGTANGIWNPHWGTWAIGPWPIRNHENVGDTSASEAAWGWSSFGCADFLADAALFLDRKERPRVAEKCTKALQWFLDECLFEDGAMGMMGRDDKWVGMAAAALLTYRQLVRKGMLSPQMAQSYGRSLAKTAEWFSAHTWGMCLS